MTNETDLTVLQGTIAAMYPRAKELVAHFYGRLFGRCPELESMFAGTTVQQQHAKLWAVLTLIGTVNDDDERSVHRFEQLSAEHVERALTVEQYRAFGDVLLASLRYFDGRRWSSEKETVWTAAIESAMSKVSGGATSISEAAAA